MATVREIMTKDPITLAKDTTVLEAAQRMRDNDIGDVVVMEDGKLCGIVTDRDLVVRSIAKGQNPNTTRLADVITPNVVSLKPNDDIETAIRLMRDKAVRRLPIVDEDDKPVGILSLGDLAIERDRDSVLAAMSAAPPQH